MPRELAVDVCIDLICPWCWIGKRALDQALAQLAELEPDLSVRVRWHSVLLLPNIPAAGLPYGEFYVNRLGSPQAVRARQAQVQAAADRVGLQIHFDRIAVFPNTAQAHRLLAYAREQLPTERLSALIERLFEAHFVLGERIGDAAALARIAAEFAVDMSGPAPAADPWSEPGMVGSVPLFVFNQRHAVSGAQPVDTLVSAMRQSALSAAELTP